MASSFSPLIVIQWMSWAPFSNNECLQSGMLLKSNLNYKPHSYLQMEIKLKGFLSFVVNLFKLKCKTNCCMCSCLQRRKRH